jgi:hypothetical protein
MAIDLPTPPIQSQFSPRMVTAGGLLRSPIGGAAIGVNHPGDRHALDVVIPPLREDQARKWRARLIRSAATRVPLRLAWPQSDMPSLGVVTVDGAGQTGMILAITGGTVDAIAPEGGYFSVSDGVRYDLYMVAEDRELSGGDTLLDIAPMLRRPPAHAAALNFASPIIEGLVAGNISWNLEMMIDQGISFSIEENR